MESIRKQCTHVMEFLDPLACFQGVYLIIFQQVQTNVCFDLKNILTFTPDNSPSHPR